MKEIKDFSFITSWNDYKFDPRYIIILFLGSFVIAGQTYLNFLQGFDAILLAVTATISTELILGKMILKKWVKPLSAFITGLGISLLISSSYLWPYMLAGFLSIAFKYALRYKGGHVFNPNNLAVVILITLIPQYAVVSPKQWSNGYLMMTFIICLGLLLVFVAKRAEVTLTFITAFLVIGYIRHLVFEAPLWAAVGPLLGASTQLFLFFMITDPKTSPNTTGGKVLFALTIAVIDGVLRINRIPFAPFYALFFTSILFTIPYRMYLTRKQTMKEVSV